MSFWSLYLSGVIGWRSHVTLAWILFFKPPGRTHILETIAVSEKTLTPVSQLVLTTQEIQIILNQQLAEQEEGFQVLQMKPDWIFWGRVSHVAQTALEIAADQRMTWVFDPPGFTSQYCDYRHVPPRPVQVVLRIGPGVCVCWASTLSTELQLQSKTWVN